MASAAVGYCSRPMRALLDHHVAIYILILVISTSSTSHSTVFNAQGRRLHPQMPENSKNKAIKDNAIFRPQIGSRPPQCDRRCSSCTHCEAIQVPTNPTGISGKYSTTDDVVVSATAYSRDDEGSSNYKPMSWKCKCGDLIFNP